MPPVVALVICLTFTAYLLRQDASRRPGVSNAIWIPLLWMMIIGSRLVSQWLSFDSPSGSLQEGNALDASVFSILMVAGLFVLSKRSVGVTQIVTANLWITVFFLYGAISIMWSDFPFVAMKRWIKEVGILVMVLVVLTEKDPAEAAKALIRRCAFVLVPLSVILIKYYPDLGKQYSYWSGEAHFVGVTTSKNMLGNLCLVSGLFFIWSLFTLWRKRNGSLDRHDLFVHSIVLGMIWWLLSLSSSATSLMCLGIGVCIILAFELPILRRNSRAGANAIVWGMALVMVLESVFGLSEVLVPSLGRDATLTGRSEIWSEVLGMVSNPMIGTGFDSFWLGERLDQMWARHWWKPTGSHNGYLETYINLGWIGVALLCCLLISVFRKIRDELVLDYDYGRFEMAFLGIALVYNLTEAAFKGTILVWFMLLLIAVRAPAKPERRLYQGFAHPQRIPQDAPLPQQSS